MKLACIAATLVATFGAAAQTTNIDRIVIQGRVFTNATLIVLNSSNAMLRSGLVASRVNLADLPEPWRSYYYDPKKIQADRDKIAAVEQKKYEAQRARELAEIEAREKRQAAEAERLKKENEPWVSNSWIEVSKGAAVRDRFGGMTITGILTSKAEKKTLTSLTIRFNIYDGDGNKIGEARDYVGSLAPRENWKYEATSLTKAGSYSLDRVTSSQGRLD